MAKKEFKGGFNKLLGTNKKANKEAPAPKKSKSEIAKKKVLAKKQSEELEELKKMMETELEAEKEEIKPTSKRGRGRPKTSTRVITKSSQEGTVEGESRATFILKESLIEQLKDIAYWDRKRIKDTVGDALSEFVAQWKKDNGKVKPRPK